MNALRIGQVVSRILPGGGLSASYYWVDRITPTRVRLVQPGRALWVRHDEIEAS